MANTVKITIDGNTEFQARNKVFRFLRAPGIEVISIDGSKVSDSDEYLFTVQYEYSQPFNEEEL